MYDYPVDDTYHDHQLPAQGNSNGFRPTALFVSPLPSHAADEWGLFGHPAFNEPGTSTSSASPNSLYFANSTGSSSVNHGFCPQPEQKLTCLSEGIARSYASTPLSSAGFENSRNFSSSLLETQKGQLVDTNGPCHTSFVYENPNIPKQKKDKTLRTCMTCFVKKRPCPETENPNRCTYCIGKDSYCKGPIVTPKLFNLDSLDAKGAEFLVNLNPLDSSALFARPFPSIHISLNAESQAGQKIKREGHNHGFATPERRDGGQILWDNSTLEKVLDIVHPSSTPFPPQLESGSFDLSVYEWLCHRFCACMSLLRDPNRSTVDSEYTHSAEASHTVVGLFCLLTHKASGIFDQIYDQIRTCCFATRDKRRTLEFMFGITKHLGYMHKGIECFYNTLAQWDSSPFFLRDIFFNAPQTLNDIENLSLGLCAKAFAVGRLSDPLRFSGIHITPASTQTPIAVSHQSDNTFRKLSLLQMLQGSIAPDLGWTPSAANEYAHASQAHKNSLHEASRYNHPGVLSHAGGIISGDLDRQISGNSASTFTENLNPQGFCNTQGDVYATLKSSWAFETDLMSTLQNVQKSNDNYDQPAKLLEMPTFDFQANENQNLQHDKYHLNNSPSSAPIHGDLPEVQPATHGVAAPSHDLADPPYLDLTSENNTFTMSGHNDAISAPSYGNDEAPERRSKRKRILSFIPQNKSRLISNRLFRCELPDSPNAIVATTNMHSVESSPEITDEASESHPARHPNADLCPRIVQTDWVTDWERAGCKEPDSHESTILKDVNVSESERRPMSWPRQRMLRKSLDVSVAVLRRNFERLSAQSTSRL